MPSTAAALLLPPPAAPRSDDAPVKPEAAPESGDPSFSQRLTAADERPKTDAPADDAEVAEIDEDTPASTDPLVLADLAALVVPAVLPQVALVADPLADLAVAPIADQAAAAVTPAALSAQTAVAGPQVTDPTLAPVDGASDAVIAPAPLVNAPRPAPTANAAAADEAAAPSDTEVTDGADQPAATLPIPTTIGDVEMPVAMQPTPPPAPTVDEQATDTTATTALSSTSERPVNAPAREVAPAAAPRAAPEPNPAERALANQVVRAVMRHDAEGGRSLVVRLTPPELGTVKVEIIERAGTLSARISSDDDAVRTALERALPQMRQELRASDAPVRDVALADGWFGDAARRGRNGAEQRTRRDRSDGDAVFSLDGVAPAAAISLPTHQLGGVIAADRVDAHA